MTDARPMASLKPALLARKGGARPAIRAPQPELAEDEAPLVTSGKVVTLKTSRKVAPAGKANPVRRQRERLAESLAKAPVTSARAAPSRPTAFTLRLDAQRHLKLRLASALTGRSAQQLVVEALDALLVAHPDLADLAARASKAPSFRKRG